MKELLLKRKRNFNNIAHFQRSILNTLKEVFISDSIEELDFIMENNNETLRVRVLNYAIHIHFDNNFSSTESFIEPVTNCWVRKTKKSIYIYPRDRNAFRDTPLGMQQRAYYFVVCLQIVLNSTIKDESNN